MHTMGQTDAGFSGAAIFFLIWFLMMGGMIVGWIIFLIAIWKAMKAHQSIAQTLQQIAQKSSDTPVTANDIMIFQSIYFFIQASPP